MNSKEVIKGLDNSEIEKYILVADREMKHDLNNLTSEALEILTWYLDEWESRKSKDIQIEKKSLEVFVEAGKLKNPNITLLRIKYGYEKSEEEESGGIKPKLRMKMGQGANIIR